MKKNKSDFHISRRHFLKLGTIGAMGLHFGSNAFAKDLSTTKSRKGQAKAVIEIWMWGGPSHLDTFDPKPEAGYDYMGNTTAIPTNIDGIQISNYLPLLAKQADKYSLLRSMTHGVNGHETATYMMQTGRSKDAGDVFPSIGAVVSKIKGDDSKKNRLLPPYIALTRTHGRFSEEGFLGAKYKPFATGGNPNKDIFEVEGLVAKGMTDDRQRSRRDLLHDLDTLGQNLAGCPEFQKLDQCENDAYGMIFGEARQVFDLSKEPKKLRDRYGRNTFGQSCLMARRLVEAGTQYVSINAKGWDTHKMHFASMARMLPEMDGGIATLLEDLADRGMLDDTIVWCCGEFGRTPDIKWNAPWNGGRSHHGACFSAMVAGGGFKGGQVVGSSDKIGKKVHDRPIYPQDLIGSIYEKLGIDPEGPLPNSCGKDVALTEPSKGKGRLYEIM